MEAAQTASPEVKIKITSPEDLYRFIQKDSRRVSEFQHYCGRFVDREVHVCQSSLVEELLSKSVFQWDDIENSYSYRDEADNEYDTMEEYEAAKEECQKELEELEEQLEAARELVSDGYTDGDYLTEDYEKFYQYGELVLTVEYSDGQDDEEMWEQIRAHMDAANFFPDVYYEDERGDVEIMIQEPSAQREFEEAIGALQRHKARLRAATDSCHTLFAALQHRAFHGEL